MGSFNTTCFVTRQTIAPGDACRVVPILQKKSFKPVKMQFKDQSYERYGATDSTCYPDAFWGPAGDFIEAKYYDYGQVEVLDMPKNRLLMFEFFLDLLENAPVVEQGENQYHDVPFDFNRFMADKAPKLKQRLDDKNFEGFHEDPAVFEDLVTLWNYTWDAAHEHRLFHAKSARDPRPMQFAVMHEAAFQALIAQTAAHTTWQGESLEQMAFLTRSLAKAKDEAEEVVASMRTEILKPDLPADQRPALEEAVASQLEFSFIQNLRDAIFGLSNSFDRMSMSDYRQIRQVGKDYLRGTATVEDVKRRLQHMLDARYVMSGLEELNLHFSPVMYASQDYNNSIGRAYLKLVTDVSTHVSAARNRDD